jgi:outer membrane protein assembly factor BamB
MERRRLQMQHRTSPYRPRADVTRATSKLRPSGGYALAAVLAAVLVSGCSGNMPKLPSIKNLNPFAEAPPPPLPGERIAVLPEKDKVGGAELATADQPIALPAPVTNVAWSQPGGTASNAPGHLALNARLSRAWSQSAGTGSSSTGRLTASPVVFDGRVYTLDAAARVTAFNASSGSTTWRLSLAPDGERAVAGYGGGLALDGERLIVATGFGTISALDPRSGKKIWETNLKTPVRASPTAAEGRIFVITSDGRFFCLNAADGSNLWEYRGLPEQNSLISNPSPAVQGNVVAVPYPNGDVAVLSVNDGTLLWTESLARMRGASSFASMSDAARPAIADGLVFAVGHAGRMIAARVETGERLWSLDIPGNQAPWVAGDHVFVVDTAGKLSAIGHRTGMLKWAIKLPEATTWSGPVLAGSTLWLTSHRGHLVGVDASTGRVTQKMNTGDAVYIAPVVADGRLFVLTDKATLISYR